MWCQDYGWYSQGIHNVGLCDVHFVDSHNSVPVGDVGRILSKTDGGATWDRVESGVTEPLFRLDFGSRSHGIIAGAMGTIKSVTVLVNEVMQMGTYEVTFDANQIPLDVYHYHNRANGARQTKSFIVTR